MGSLTRQHFEALARALKDNAPDRKRFQEDISGEPDAERASFMRGHFYGRRYVWNGLYMRVSGVCRSFNSGFDSDKFKEAAGYYIVNEPAAKTGPGK